jgi:uncharacterized protein (DUF1800 family)
VSSRRKARRRPRRTSKWTRRHVERLLWRAGFGGRPSEVDYWARRSRRQLIDWLIKGGRGPHGTARMVGRAPTTQDGPLDPVNHWGHDALWWLDRMVRSQRPLVEKLTLFWHDHFATRDQEVPLMLAQNQTLRAHALGSFDELLQAITQDTAMSMWLSLANSSKRAPNENFARELMELFTLGHGAGYTETDVQEAARALTGFWLRRDEAGIYQVYYDPARHDDGVKTVLGRTGTLAWPDVLDACVSHPAHAPFLVSKLWAFFVAEPLDDRTRDTLVGVYTGSGRRIAPLVRAILEHPALYAGLDRPTLVKWPAVYVAGLLRQVGRTIDVLDWAWLLEQMGQKLFWPPSVAGWDTGPDWMSTSTMRARFVAASTICGARPVAVKPRSSGTHWTAAQHLERARRATGRPFTTPATDRRLRRLAAELLASEPRRNGRVQPYVADLTQSALRHLLLSGPDNQLC